MTLNRHYHDDWISQHLATFTSSSQASREHCWLPAAPTCFCPPGGASLSNQRSPIAEPKIERDLFVTLCSVPTRLGSRRSSSRPRTKTLIAQGQIKHDAAWHQYNVHCNGLDWIEQCFTSPPTQYRSRDGFYRSGDPTNSIKVMKGHIHNYNYTINRKNTISRHKHKTQQVP